MEQRNGSEKWSREIYYIRLVAVFRKEINRFRTKRL